MSVSRLRAIIAQYGKPGLLFVACYLTAHHFRHRWRIVGRVAGTLSLLLIGLIGGMALFSRRPSHPVPQRFPAPVPVADAVPAPPVRKPASEAALREAERLLAANPDTPPFAGKPLAKDYNVWDARQQFQALLNDDAASDRAALCLARCEMQLGHYEAAEAAWSRACLLVPENPVALRGWEQARRLLAVQRAVETQIPAGHAIARILPFRVNAAQRFWAVLHGKIIESEEERRHFLEMRLTLFSDLPDSRPIGKSFPLNYARSLDAAFMTVTCHALDMTRDGVPELVVHELTLGGSWSPSQMEIFAWHGGGLKRVLQLQSSKPLCLEDIHRDGMYQVRNQYEIGTRMCHAEQPRWSDVYAWQNGMFVQANRRFPEAFRQWPAKLKAALKEFPGDPEIEAYLCMTYAILGRKAEAGTLHKRAVAYFRRQHAYTKLTVTDEWHTYLADVEP